MTTNVDSKALNEVSERYDLDGAAVIRDVVSQPWLDRLAEGTDRLMSGSGADRNLSRPGEG